MNSNIKTNRDISVFWFRRDLRLEDNTGLVQALRSGFPVLPVFIFDTNILDELPADDPRVSFIYKQLQQIHGKLAAEESGLQVFKGEPVAVWKDLLSRYRIKEVYVNKDYEPYAMDRDRAVAELLEGHGTRFHPFKDQVIFEEGEVLKQDGNPYTVFTPYKRKWLKTFRERSSLSVTGELEKGFLPGYGSFPSLEAMGFQHSAIHVRPYDLSRIRDYPQVRDLPAAEATSHLSPHLRFGTISIRKVINGLAPTDEVFLSELIWREFFMQILFHFPKVVNQNFHPKYNGIHWKNDPGDFRRWCGGRTGYPMVDAGMRQLNETGTMHNRVRMVTASFLCKHLLVDWRMGEAYFASRLLDYELSSNNGNWQWAAGTGCDAAPYFRIFNPAEQQKRFDPDQEYVRNWIPEYGTPDYPDPMIDHKFARERALSAYKKGFESYLPEG
jgi:deoxyribodipyrimidine photo-lyase